jgi:electron transport complex protein RnfB
MPAVSTPASTLADRLDHVLPQTQCARCGHAGCRPYAEAMAAGHADINRCPPGGDETVVRLADLTGRPVKALDRSLGEPGHLLLARIDEATCIGCTLCIAACPVDAIVGAQKRMHAVVASLCSGCELCIAPCPVDCITMHPAGHEWTTQDAAAARIRHDARAVRLARNERISQRTTVPEPPASADPTVRRQAAVAAAQARARARRSASAHEP